MIVRLRAREDYWTPAQRAQYANRLETLLEESAAMTDSTVRRIRKLLTQMQRDLTARIPAATAKVQGGGSSFDLARTTALLRDIDELSADLRARMTATQSEGLQGQWEQGRRMIDEPLQIVAGSEILPAVGLSRSTLATAQAFSADLITDITGALRRRINAEIQQGLVGMKTPYEVMQAIGDQLPNASVFQTIELRAETIVRTEMGRAYSLAGQARLQEAQLVVPGLKKQWRWSGRSRANHAAIDGQLRDVDLPFDVPPGRYVEGAQMMYPKDPAAPAGQTINCGCQSLPYVPGLSRELPAAA